MQLVMEVDDFDVRCMFRDEAGARYCSVNLKKVWREDGTDAMGDANEKTPSNFRSHFAGGN